MEQYMILPRWTGVVMRVLTSSVSKWEILRVGVSSLCYQDSISISCQLIQPLTEKTLGIYYSGSGSGSFTVGLPFVRGFLSFNQGSLLLSSEMLISQISLTIQDLDSSCSRLLYKKISSFCWDSIFCYILGRLFCLRLRFGSCTNYIRLLYITSMRPFSLVTTPIFYLNSAPHLGHAYSLLLASAIARVSRAPLVTGTDEHGTKVSQAALKQQQDVKQFCDRQSLLFKSLLNQIGVEAACFIRTTDPDHKATVCDFWSALSKDLKSNSYQGYYSESDQCFVRTSELTEDKRTALGHPTQFMSEINYVFNLQHQAKFLQDFIPNFVHPKHYVQPLLSDLSQLKLLSVSRPSKRVPWAIPVPNDASQTVYVWVDALCNYVTAAKRLNIQNFNVCHVIGKDILKFHSIFWPALLKAAGRQLPSKLLVHCHWTSLGRKMSKSLGNVVCPVQMVRKYGMDAFRLYCLTQGPLQTDRDFQEIALKEVFNNFVSSFCNLVIRVTAPKIIQGQMKLTRALSQEQLQLLAQIDALILEATKFFEDFKLKQVYIHILTVTALLNKFTNHTQPWKKPLIQRTHLAYFIAEALRLTTLHMLVPFLPQYSEAVLALFQSRTSEFRKEGCVQVDQQLRMKCHMKRVTE